MKNMAAPKHIRCAIYTRKSSEEGLEQSFNSLHAQREACEAYIKSQAHEGWVLVDNVYDDGGFSGGNVDRPALTALLADIDAGRIDLVLVYKVDRLSRSLADFVRLIERFDQQDIAFVSVTQQFNTTSSMGRLTLNVLLSFAQFEREVTSERIRDKIAASKKKGMWMGGTVPLGYDVLNRQLCINSEEAQQVERLYYQYLEFDFVGQLKAWCDEQGILSKQRVTRQGKHWGGNALTRGALYNILKNPIYIGKISHQGALYEGQHQPILSVKLWEQVQANLKSNSRKKQLRTEAKHPSLLAGLLFDDRENPMSPSHSKKGNRRYCYYVSQAKLQMRQEEAGSLVSISSEQLDPLVIDQLSNFLGDTDTVLQNLPISTLNGEQRKDLLDKIEEIKSILCGNEIKRKISVLNTLIRRIEVGRQKLRIAINPQGLLSTCLPCLDKPEQDIHQTPIVLKQTVYLKRTGIESRLVVECRPDNKLPALSRQALGQATLKAFRWYQSLITGKVDSVKTLAQQENVTERFIQQRLRLALLSPDTIQQLIEGNTEVNLSLEQLKTCAIPSNWTAQ